MATPDSIETWLARAQTSTRAELQEHVQVEKAKRLAQVNGDVGPEPLVSWTVRVTLEQRELIDLAIEQVAVADPPKLLGRGAALELICLESLAKRLPGEKALVWLIRHIERVHGVKLTVATGARASPHDRGRGGRRLERLMKPREVVVG